MSPPVPEPADLGALVGSLRSNEHITDVTTTALLSAAECEAVVAQLVDDGWREMEVWETTSDSSRPVAHRRVAASAVRRGLQQPVPGGNSGPLATRIAEQVYDLNQRIYRFRLVGIEHPVEVLCYRAESTDEYLGHMDLGPATSLRKLSFSLLLSDPATFEGGDLAFGAPFALARQQGTLTIFPSFLQHAVTPVTRGVRHAVVGFVLGPAFS